MNVNEYSQKKQHILEAAIIKFTENGFDKTSLREIASAAGLTTGAIYHHFKNKDELFYHAVKEAMCFAQKLSEKDENSNLKSAEDMLDEISNKVKERMSKINEQRLLVLLIGYVLSKGGALNESLKQDYNEIISKVADMYFFAFGIENEYYKKSLASILIAALDGVAMQYSLGVLKQEDQKFKDIFVNFFIESIPAFMQKYKP
ncbi:TetR/AcrR family transcriptional regulator [Clostridium botulinum]|uniref:Transcriptional regulator, TetR family n=1 Tax=Clostridium botulinum (strain Langeland / NCTC 10281 / Type F) TaxID=441772 RepID=A7GAJ1_CLOBL|nr:TetR/AcrR family transcriptional regulator [Clostridium botulinum]ABS39945.1 transcriptional regulator, TetR family [Clostridium botulinum F str. Langeland]ADF98265.1 transcriptional regulator, TetR family [Clostridium botulinum F str. 230613]KKM40496.1 TetR family transcriptional regulator [Clostridium botulinum]MBD5644168.1 TetR/AcrR family transcriptional regulator [Clostridium botulinum]MBY6793263.1 TetR/AcrR family transcriptional regulator [Clostridium botulinum]